MIYILTITN